MPRHLVLSVLAVGAALTPSCAEAPTPVAQSSAPVPSVAAVPSPDPTVSPSASPSASPAAGPPVDRRLRYTFPLRCRTSYGRSHHDYPATDVFAPRGCRFVSPVDGRVHEVGRTDRWDASTNRGADRGGRFVSVIGVDGVRYYGSHLDRVADGVQPGVGVAHGDVLGRVGTSGNARGTPSHLHFGLSWPTGPDIWWVRRGTVYPWPYLDSWRSGGDRSPVAAVRRAHREQGDAPPCRAGC